MPEIIICSFPVLMIEIREKLKKVSKGVSVDQACGKLTQTCTCTTLNSSNRCF